MNVTSVALVLAALGVNFGWQPSPEDPQAYEVLMQVEPELVDVLADGSRVPIESHVPASVTPIRNIRVIVGTDELPRTPLATESLTKAKPERIVRGQEPAAVEHTARFQSDDGWSGDRYTPTTAGGNRQFDQRGATIGGEPIRVAETNPWSLDGAQQAATDAGNSLRNSVNSGAEQVNQQGQQLLNSAPNTGSDFGQQLQNMTGFGGQSSPTSSPTSSAPLTSAARSGSSASQWPAPPPLASPQSTAPTPLANAPSGRAIAPNSWSSIRPELAPPRLATPPLASGVRVASNTSPRSSAGPSFPPPPAAGDRSLLAPPVTASNSAADQDWSSIWGTNSSPSAARNDDAGVGLVPVPPRPRTSAAPATVATNPISSTTPTVDRYGQSAVPAPAPPAANNGADVWANFGQPQNNNFDPRPQPIAPPPTQPSLAATPQNQPFGSANQATIGTQPPATQQTTAAGTGEEVPWKPLLGVSLALAGSVGANFFLGMSYADARRRYLSLVAKTTHAFQKEAGIAA